MKRIKTSNGAYTATTQGVRVTVEPQFLEEESNAAEARFVWAYTVAIENRSRGTVQILARHWIITDQNGRREDVRGLGVVGEQPIIDPGATFTYTSGCPLATPSGTMVGTYQAVGPDGKTLTVEIPAFSLDLPGARRVLN